ncbi:hypothetical protein BDR26DRAFT_870929 [Obelidium mucronatum]|nr:hypothetical protein BDR26DRAFT_870929 [Obelidium mucronatum]
MPASATQTLPPIGSSLPPSPAQQIPATSSYLRPQAPGSAGSYSSPAPPPPPAIIPTKPIQAPQAPATIKRHGTTKVFLSFHPESSSFVTSLSAYLVDTYGVNIQIIQGQFKEMDSCDFVIIVLSPKYETSKWHRKEAGYAVMTKKELIPILVDQEGGVVEGDEIPGLSIVGERVVDLRGSKAEDIAAEAVARIDEMSLL